MPPEVPYRKRIVTRLDHLAGELNRCLAVAAIGLACVDLLGYAAVAGRAHSANMDTAAWQGPAGAVGTTPPAGAVPVE